MSVHSIIDNFSVDQPGHFAALTEREPLGYDVRLSVRCILFFRCL